MPSIADQLHTLGALMKTNLERKGVTGLTTSMGLTTLANKILDIDCQGGGGDGLYLSGSSSIIQIDETCTLNAVLLSNNAPVENELIVLYSNKDSPIPVDSVDIANFELKFGNIDAFMGFADNIPSGFFVEYYASNNQIIIMYVDGEEITKVMSGTVLYKVGTTFFTDFGDSITVPSKFATLSERTRSGIQANDFTSIIGAGFTNVVGVVTADYVGTGAGDVIVYAKCTRNGSLLQETYEVRDIYYANIGDTDKSSDININSAYALDNRSIGALSITNSNGQYSLTQTGAGNYTIVPIPILNTIKVPFKLRVEFISDVYGLYLGNDHIKLFRITADSIYIITSRTTVSHVWTSMDNLNGTFHHLTLEIISNNGTITFNAYSGETQVYSYTITDQNYNNCTNSINYGFICYNNNPIFKNITAELL